MLGKLFLASIGLCGGGLVAAGLYAFITVLGLVPRLAARTHTASQIHRYENWIVAGALAGNLLGIHQLPFGWIVGKGMGGIFAGIIGTSCGIFVGCLVMSLAETLDAIPTMSRRIRLAVGIQYIIEALAIGKLVGSFAYFVFQISQ